MYFIVLCFDKEPYTIYRNSFVIRCPYGYFKYFAGGKRTQQNCSHIDSDSGLSFDGFSLEYDTITNNKALF